MSVLSLFSRPQLTGLSSRGKYDSLRKYASSAVVEEVKAQRDRKLQGLALDWKMHRVVEQKILCMREQEIFKKDEFVGQVAVRFTTLQVRSHSSRSEESRTDEVVFRRVSRFATSVGG